VAVVLAKFSSRRGFESETPRRVALARSIACAVILVVSGATGAAAAELRLREECRCTQSLVRLGDIAEIHAADAEQAHQLEAIELFPAPAVGRRRFVRAREVQDLLALRGLNLSEHRLSGASRVQVSTADATAEPPMMAPRPLSSSAMMRANELVEQAVIEYLRHEASEAESWQVELKLDGEQARIVSAGGKGLTVDGGEAPWRGCKRLKVVVPGEEGRQEFEIEAVISTPPMVVVAVRSLTPGDTVQATDVKLAQRQSMQAQDPFYRLEDVIGQQTTGAIVEGQVLEQADVRSPLLVRRGDAVTVFARSAGIQVRTTARAQEDGGRGDLITVESMLNRQRFFVRVTGIHEAEVFAHAVEARSATSEPAASAQISPVAKATQRAAPAGYLDRQVRPAGYQGSTNQPRRSSR
jgi:flagella basal body P-ring formation protein FlgA